MRGFSLIPHTINVNFFRYRYFAFLLSLALVFGSFFLLGTRGLNFGIDFTGGTAIEIRSPEKPDLGKLRESLNALSLGDVLIQEFGQPQDLLIRLPQQKETPEALKAYQDCLEQNRKTNDQKQCPTAQSEAIAKVQGSLKAFFTSGEVDYRRVEFVGPQVGEELKRQGLIAITLSILAIMGYIWLRFEWQFAISATVATTLHDVVLTLGLFSLTRMQFDVSTLAAILLVAGYSVNDTVVVFDRIREDMRKYKKKPLPELINVAINETLPRTTMTSFTTLLALFALYFFGGEVIRGFVYALIFGIVVGTYSSIYVAAPLLVYLGVRPSSLKPSGDQAPEAA
ncbi:MAG: protein translocase subunit SecF [Alphaproteobacteria bacterium]|nr:protein translocase subunit SecF [Alphaproteobacteria bacterium]MBP7758795.1 protein translocase subunit SecF [Alphaproteobacteria bacterium]MBP7762131.1 protein translocase subunit SecF [Alphaproteobacteria bacterium]MBP7904144.1 protein translocase subunit SecF [Alphaproteobacteria bacterium]